ncbi:MAG: hypothetical protein IT384_02780 [Deltaproteobacteria bacterium]|nr:hypothetical protein [Deltaproteobacteria bacterium]
MSKSQLTTAQVAGALIALAGLAGLAPERARAQDTSAPEPLEAKIEAAPESEAAKPQDATVVGERKSKKKRFGKLAFGATVGGGYDSNVFNKPPQKSTRAGLGEVSTALKLDVPASAALSWRSKAGLGGSYRSGDGDLGASAAKLAAQAKTGLELLVFGKRNMPGGKKVPKKKQVFPNARLSATFSYGMSVNPVIKEAAPEALVQGLRAAQDPAPLPEELGIDPDIVGEDLDEEFEEDLGDDFGDDDDGDDDEGEEGDEESSDEDQEEAEEAEEEEFIEEDVLEGKSFSLEGFKQKIGGNVGFKLDPIRGTSLGLTGALTRGDNPEVDGKPSPDFLQFGGAVKVKQKIVAKYLKAKVGYGIDSRSFDEKVTAAGDPVSFLMHGITAELSSKPTKELKLSVDYRFKLRSVAVDENLDSRRHAWGFGAQYKLTKGVALMTRLSFADQALLNADTADAGRFQGILGLRVKI